jgi:hypothetical protein
MLRGMRSHQPVLDSAPGLRVARICSVADLNPVTGGTPRLNQWALLCGWDSRQARDDFMGTGALEPFRAGAKEAFDLALDPVRVVRGDWHGWQPSTADSPRLEPDEPVVVMTYGLVRGRYLPTFTWNNRKVVRQLRGDPSLGMLVGLADHPRARCTVSLWRSEESMLRFAYGDGVHDPVQRRSLGPPWADDYFFARFRPSASTGSWGGRDPLEGSGT